MRGFLVVVLALAANSGLGHLAAGMGFDDSQVQRLDPKAGMHPPKATFEPEATYTLEARRHRLNGKCLVSIVVGVDGLTHNVQVIRCSDPLFAQSSIASVSRYTFIPATTATGVAVPVYASVEVDYRIEGGHDVIDPVRVSFSAPKTTGTSEGDRSSIDPLTMAEDPPKIAKYVDKGYGRAAFTIEGASTCDVLLTINAKGKPSSASVSHCDSEVLAPVAVNSLLASKYSPATLNGKAVPVKTLVHLEYGEFPAEPAK